MRNFVIENWLCGFIDNLRVNPVLACAVVGVRSKHNVVSLLKRREMLVGSWAMVSSRVHNNN